MPVIIGGGPPTAAPAAPLVEGTPPEDLPTPTLTQVVQAHIGAHMEDVHTCSWGQVTAYDAPSQTCTVQLVARRAYVDEDGNRQTERPAPLLGVPVMFPGGSGISIYWDLQPGEFVLVMFAETAIRPWLSNGLGDVDSGDDQRHALTNAIAIPGLRPATALVQPTSTTSAGAVIGSVTASKLLYLGDNSGGPLATKADIDALATFLKGVFDTVSGHIHSGVQTGGGTSGPPGAGTGLSSGTSGVPDALGTTLVKAT